ncbi:MAG: DedA family protein [Oligoflexia bacterium]|nr:DedA family protein [Oligoflexia bacterium]
MDHLYAFLDFFLHLDKHLDALVLSYGPLTYCVLFAIIFCETGLVVTPILPGDSLLFAAGAIAGLGSLNAHLLFVLLCAAAILGDALNYLIGLKLGERVFQEKYSRIFKREYLERTHQFYEKYGSKTIIIARFVPIVRTFAPFLAGVGRMRYRTFAIYNVTGGILWIALLLYAGYFFGGNPVVKRNFSLVILAIIVISILPAVFELIRAKRQSAKR